MSCKSKSRRTTKKRINSNIGRNHGLEAAKDLLGLSIIASVASDITKK